ncbi:MAG: hypothetical protein IKB46_04425 [Paludibacteraceae bacterium]|nr:hypothetical protein [Paludibacteraceae bacterium]
MRKLFILLLLLISLTTFSQLPPAWCDHDLRRIDYPDSEYFTGYAEGAPTDSERPEIATQRLKDAARVEALSTIRIHVKNNTTNNALSQTLRSSEGTFRQSIREFTSSTTTTVDMKIPGLQIESWRDPQTGTIYAFAYVKKSTLIRQLEKQITVALTKVEMSLDQVDQLIATGQKLQARSAAEKALPLFAEVDEAQKLLVAVDAEATEETLMLSETRQLQQRLMAMVAQLKNALTICIKVHATAFDSTYPALQEELKGALSPLGCNFVTDPSTADWVINISAQAREYNTVTMGDVNTYFAYVDATVSITKTATGQRVYENMFTEKGGHTHNYHQAAHEAYKNLTSKIRKIVEEQVKQ